MNGFIPTHAVITAPDVADPPHTAVLLHGILGSKQNWRSFARRMVERLPDWRVITPDHRHHGDATLGDTAPPPPHTLDACADDVRRMLDARKLTPDAILGHSFGAKVAMTYAERYPAGLRQAWALDAVPGAVDVDALSNDVLQRHEVVRVIRALRQIPQPVTSRDEVVQRLGAMGFSDALAAWMTTNLRRDADAGGFVWRFDLDGVDALLHSYLTTDMWPFVEDLPLGLALHVVRGGRSSIWSDEVLDRLAAAPGEVRLHCIENAGHWLHAEAPNELLEILAEHLSAG